MSDDELVCTPWEKTLLSASYRIGTALLLACLFAAVFVAAPARAQNIPPSAEPGQIQRQLQRPRLPKSLIKPVLPKPKDQTIPTEKAKKLKFRLHKIKISGGTVFKAEDLLPLYKHRLGRVVSLFNIYELAAAITAKYRNAGYILSKAILPPQEIKGGHVRLQIIEGYVSSVVIQGQLRDNRNLIAGYSKKITQSRPLKAEVLERYLLLIRDLPGHLVESLLRPSKKVSGASELVVVVKYKPFDGSLTVDNRGTRFVGPRQLSANLVGNSVFGLGGTTEFRYVTTGLISYRNRRELNFVELQTRHVITNEGTTLEVGASRSFSNPGFSLTDQDVESTSRKVFAQVSHCLTSAPMEQISGIA